jgi:membrane-bound metal-dependent hydrolase YbcI (DUF457 family)
MWFLGHFAIGYFIGTLISRLTGEKVNLPLIFVFSILSDIDVFIPELVHRSITHSVVLATVLFIPIFLITRRGFPYWGALASHTIIGDLFQGTSFQLLWPVSNAYIEVPFPRLMGVEETFLESGLFLIMAFMVVKDLRKQRRITGSTVRIFNIEF